MVPASSWWTPLRVMLAITAVVFAFGVLERAPCRDHAWSRGDGQQYAHACYSDIPHMWRERGFAQGQIPYLDSGDYQALEYPVLSGAFMQVAAWITRPLAGAGIDAEAVRFYDVNAFLLGLTAMITVAATVALAGRRRPWDALALAASPMVALTATINWDLFAVALTSLGLLAWARGKPGLAGIWLGLAVSAKLYPVVILLPLAVLCLRARKPTALRRTIAGGAGAWIVVNLPVALAAPSQWWEFYEFNSHRGAEFGSIWFALDKAGHAVPALNVISAGLTVLGLLAVAGLAMLAPTRPRVMQLAFLAVAVFILFNKVWSPQYVLWLLPLAVLARPRWRDLLIWQAGEAIYFFAVWFYLLGGYDRGLPQDAYTVALLIRFAALGWLVAVVVRDVIDPRCDPVRLGGEDDPAAGVLRRVPRHRVDEAVPGMSERSERIKKALRRRLVGWPSVRSSPNEPSGRSGVLDRVPGRLSNSDRAVLRLYGLTRIAIFAITAAGVWLFADRDAREPVGFVDRWTQWDTHHYVTIAKFGYGGGPSGPQVPLEAFFPGYPIAMRVVHEVLGVGFVTAGLVISLVAGAVAVLALGRIAAEQAGGGEAGDRLAERTALLFLLAPSAVFLAAAYTEALFLAFALPAWLAARRGRWVAAALLAAGATSIRITGVFLAIALIVEFGTARDGRRQWAAAPWLVVPFVPVLAYFTYLHDRTGDWMAWQHAQEQGWYREFHWPWEALRITWLNAFDERQPTGFAWMFAVEILAVGVGLVLLVWLLRSRRWAEATYIGLQLYAFTTAMWFFSVPRATLTWWPLWIALAAWTLRAPAVHQAYLTVVAPFMVVFALLFTNGRWAG